jgi:hypothetical protein
MILLRRLPSGASRLFYLAVLSLIQIALLLGVTLAVNRSLAVIQYPDPLDAIFLYDLKGVSIEEKESLLPSYLAETDKYNSLEALKESFEPRWVNSNHSDLPKNPEQKRGLFSRWLHTLYTHPVSYLKVRARIFTELIGWARKDVCEPFHPRRFSQGKTLSSKLRATSFKVLDGIRHSFLFRGWLYFALLSIVSLAHLWRRTSIAGTAIALSGLFSVLGYFFYTHSCSFRYFYWPICALIISTLLLAKDIRSNSTG